MSVCLKLHSFVFISCSPWFAKFSFPYLFVGPITLFAYLSMISECLLRTLFRIDPYYLFLSSSQLISEPHCRTIFTCSVLSNGVMSSSLNTFIFPMTISIEYRKCILQKVSGDVVSICGSVHASQSKYSVVKTNQQTTYMDEQRRGVL